MEEILELQKETLASINEYLGNLIPGMKNAADELSGELKEDTWEYLRMIMDGFNWVIQAYNGTQEVINADAVVIDNKDIDAKVEKLGASYKTKDAAGLATSINDDIIPFLEKLKEVTAKFI